MKTDYIEGMTEFEIAIMAHGGDKNAAEILWKKYRKPMTNVFLGLPMTPGERESEAADVFMHYIKNLFDPEKEINQRENWTFFSYLYSGMLGRRSNLRKARVYAAYDESAEPDDESGALNAEKLCLSQRDLFMRYNPEDAVISELYRKKINRVRSGIDRLQKITTGYFQNVLESITAELI
jgi:hypothetical protein